MKIDTSNLGYKYFPRRDRKGIAVQWLGCVETDDGEQGALGLNNLTGAYVQMRIGSRPIELDATAVLQALGDPVRFHPPGRKARASDSCIITVTITETLRAAALAMGDGNLSLGIRRAIERAAG